MNRVQVCPLRCRLCKTTVGSWLGSAILIWSRLCDPKASSVPRVRFPRASSSSRHVRREKYVYSGRSRWNTTMKTLIDTASLVVHASVHDACRASDSKVPVNVNYVSQHPALALEA